MLSVTDGSHLESTAVACVFHGSAIITAIFRLAHQWYTLRFGGKMRGLQLPLYLILPACSKHNVKD